MSATQIQAVYRDTGVEAYRGNPFIEALPPLQESVNRFKGRMGANVWLPLIDSS